MLHAGVPIVPGTTETLSDDEAVAAATKMGLPVMIKASAGGGGKGLRFVGDPAQLAPAIARARSEAKSSFGNDAIYVEKFVEEPRHIEIQILGDSHGNVIHLFERECSIQRRHQKVIEEAPANHMPPTLREKMGRAAIAAAREVGYEGAGTVEFLVDKNDAFYFLEMNTRVQVEHPVTELITNVDIVKTGIRIAAGEPIGIAQSEVGIHGWAIECRIYAEDPDKNFLPSPGEVVGFQAPGGPGVRVDAGVCSGSTVTVHYDPLIAKLCSWGRDRGEAIERMRRALQELTVRGIKTSIPFHLRVLENEKFLAGRFDTTFIDAEMLPAKAAAAASGGEERDVAWMLAAIASASGRRDGQLKLTLGKEARSVAFAEAGADTWDVRVDAGPAVAVEAIRGARTPWSLRIAGRQLACNVDARANGKLDVQVGVSTFTFGVEEAG